MDKKEVPNSYCGYVVYSVIKDSRWDKDSDTELVELSQDCESFRSLKSALRFIGEQIKIEVKLFIRMEHFDEETWSQIEP